MHTGTRLNSNCPDWEGIDRNHGVAGSTPPSNLPAILWSERWQKPFPAIPTVLSRALSPSFSQNADRANDELTLIRWELKDYQEVNKSLKIACGPADPFWSGKAKIFGPPDKNR